MQLKMQFRNGPSRMIWGTKRIQRTARLLGLIAVLAAAFAFAAPLEAQEGPEAHYVDLVMLHDYGQRSENVYKVQNVGTATATGVTVSFLLEGLDKGGDAFPDQRTVDGTNQAFTWEIGTLPPGQVSAAVEFSTGVHPGIQTPVDWPGHAGVINATASALEPEPSILLVNNHLAVYAYAHGGIRNRADHMWRSRLALLLSVDNLWPEAGGDVNFGLSAQNYSTGQSIGGFYGGHIADINIQVELSQGLQFKAGWVPPGEFAIAFSGRSATWQPAVVDKKPNRTGNSNPPFQEIAIQAQLTQSDSLDDIPLEERCITAWVSSSKPPPNLYFPLGYPLRRLTQCLGDDPLVLFDAPPGGRGVAGFFITRQQLQLFTIHPCVGVAPIAYPCRDEDGDDTADNGMEMVAHLQTDRNYSPRRQGVGRSDYFIGGLPYNSHGYLYLRPGSVIVQVNDPDRRVVDADGNLGWWAGEEEVLEITTDNRSLSSDDWTHVRWEMASVQRPSDGHARFFTTVGGFEYLNTDGLQDPADGTFYEFASGFKTNSATYLKFDTLGAYVFDFTQVSRNNNGTTGDATDDVDYSATGRYTFHVGPVAELTVREGGANPDLPAGQRAFTIVAVNNGPDDAPAAQVTVTLPTGATYQSHTASAGTYDSTVGVWTVGELQHTDSIRNRQGRDGEVLTIIVDYAGSGTAAASIVNTMNYSVCIDSAGDDLDHDDQAACEAVTGASWHTTPVLDHRSDNNDAAITAANGTGAHLVTLPSDQPDTASLVLHWDAVAEVDGYPVLHYEVWRTDNCADYETCAGEAAQVGVVDGVADPMYVDTDVATGSLYAYQVRAVSLWGVTGFLSQPVSLWGAKGRLSEPVIRKAGVPIPPPDPNSAPMGLIRSADPLVVGDPVNVRLDDQEIDYLARIVANPNQQATDPCVGYVARSDVSIPAWQWQRADAQSGDPNRPDGATWTDIDRTGYTGPSYIYVPAAGDQGKFLRATLTYGNPPATVTTGVAGPVGAAAPETANAALSGTAEVGQTLTASLTAAGATDLGDWQWEVSSDYTADGDDSNDTWTYPTITYEDCVAALNLGSRQFGLTGNDAGKFFRAYVHYTDGDGNRKRAQTGVSGPVAVAQGQQQKNLPVIAITAANGAVAEGTDGAATATVSLSAASAETVTVNWQTTDGTAAAGEDYTAAAGTLTFAPGGPLARKVSVAILDDTEYEANPETFNIVLSNPSNAAIDPNNDRVTVTITSDDPAPPGNPPVFDAGTGAFTVAENTTAVGTVTATDPDVGDRVTFTLGGGADEAKFAITPEGVLTFLTAPDHERPADAGGDNGYQVVVRASDGSLSADQTVTVTVTDAAETDATLKALSLADQDGNPVDIGTFAPATTAYAASVGSQVTNVTATATPNHPDAAVAVTGGAALAEGENTVTVTVTAEDGSATQDYVITVTRAAAEAANNPPVFDAGTDAFTVAENTTAVGTVTATDPDVGDRVTFTLGGGADAAQFAITPEGALTFLTAPDHEQPADAGGDNGYQVVVRASDGSLTADQTVTVTVTDAAETDATLKALSLADQDGNPVDIGTFAPATTAYAASVGNEVTGVTATATPNHPDATVAVTGGAALAEGENRVVITVTAEDGSATQDYVITVTRAAAETAEKPGTVRNLSVSVGAGSLTISWEAPDTGGAASGYDVDYDLAGGVGEWVTVLEGGEAISVTVTGLAPGEYRIRVRANNQYGSSKWVRDRVTVGG